MYFRSYYSTKLTSTWNSSFIYTIIILQKEHIYLPSELWTACSSRLDRCQTTLATSTHFPKDTGLLLLDTPTGWQKKSREIFRCGSTVRARPHRHLYLRSAIILLYTYTYVRTRTHVRSFNNDVSASPPGRGRHVIIIIKARHACICDMRMGHGPWDRYGYGSRHVTWSLQLYYYIT